MLEQGTKTNKSLRPGVTSAITEVCTVSVKQRKDGCKFYGRVNERLSRVADYF